MPFGVLRTEYDRAGNVAARRMTQPVFEFDEDALALAEFVAWRADPREKLMVHDDTNGRSIRNSALKKLRPYNL